MMNKGMKVWMPLEREHMSCAEAGSDDFNSEHVQYSEGHELFFLAGKRRPKEFHDGCLSR